MDIEGIVKTALATVGSLGAIAQFGSRKRRLRHAIKENLDLVADIEKNATLSQLTPATTWLQGRIAVDIARLAGHRLGTPKKPIEWGSLAAAVVFSLAFGAWTYWIVRDGFEWYSLAPGTVSFLLIVSIAGMFMDRELPPDKVLPDGAVMIPDGTAEEQVASAIALAASGDLDERYEDDGQVGVVLRFIKSLQSEKYEEAWALLDENYQLCRMQAWLWNNRDHFPEYEKVLEEFLNGEPTELFDDFRRADMEHLQEGVERLDLSHYGAASKRRRIGRNHDLVILAPTYSEGGYYVRTATMIPDAECFVVSRYESDWLVSAVRCAAPPTPGWPPSWWVSGDPALDGLTD